MTGLADHDHHGTAPHPDGGDGAGAGGAVVLGDGAWTYDWHDRPRPFVHPACTPAGHVLTVDAPNDHPWHHGLWFTIKFVDGDNFWEEYGDFGLLRQSTPPRLATTSHGAERASSDITWVRPDGSVALEEQLVLTHHPLGPDAHALDWDVTLTTATGSTLDRTPFTTWGGYGGLTVRGRPDWHDTVLRLPDGVERERILGETAPWCALDGPVHDDIDAGLAIFDHPANARFPTPWYASTRADTYGNDGWSNFANAAFLWDEPLTVQAGEPLRVLHRVVAHDGRWDTDRLSAEWDRWVSSGPPAARSSGG